MACAAIVRNAFGVALFAAAAALWQPPVAHAAEPATGSADAVGTSWHQKTAVIVEPSVELWTGSEAYRHVSALYAGATWSPFTNLRQDGLRLRVVGGQSDYRYAGTRYDPGTDAYIWENFRGRARFVDILAGWQFSAGTTTVKAFGGFGLTAHQITPSDPSTQVQGTAQGLKGALEIWHNWTPLLWSSLDLSLARAHMSYAAQLRTGWRFGNGWSAGPEVSVAGHSETEIRRAGLFIRNETPADEWVVSGGVSRGRGDSPSAYATGQYLRRF